MRDLLRDVVTTAAHHRSPRGGGRKCIMKMCVRYNAAAVTPRQRAESAWVLHFLCHAPCVPLRWCQHFGQRISHLAV
eukprot:12854-Heterococcus_DN1.PRE.1